MEVGTQTLSIFYPSENLVKMVGILAPLSSRAFSTLYLTSMLPLFLPLRPSLRRLKYPLNSSIHTRFVAMAQQDPQINSPEIKEPTPKIQKLDQNGAHQLFDQIPSFLRVKKLSEKAILPSRGSLLSAGYDLSR